MEMTLRWYGTGFDTVTLKEIRQIPGVTGVITTLYDTKPGEVWSRERIRALKQEVEGAGLHISGIESVNVHDAIKTGAADRDVYVGRYIETLENLGQEDIHLVCYNFMPVFDWTRTELARLRPDGSTVLAYTQEAVDRLDPETMFSSIAGDMNGTVLPGWEPERMARVKELFGIVNVIFFSPEDLNIIKNGPAERRRFLDLELCQLNKVYVYDLVQYNRVVVQRNKLLKEMDSDPSLKETLNIWDSQLVRFGSELIRLRTRFVEELNELIREIHFHLSGEREELEIRYEPNVTPETFEAELSRNRNQELRQRLTLTGPHRDDLNFIVNGADIRKFGSQGQQRTAALSLKLSEIELVKRTVKDYPVLLLDDVLSELDGKRQEHLLSEISHIQTLITCTGLDEFVNSRFQMDKIFKIVEGTVESEELCVQL